MLANSATMAKGQGLLEHFGQSLIKGLAMPGMQSGGLARVSACEGGWPPACRTVDPHPDLGQQRVSIKRGASITDFSCCDDGALRLPGAFP